MLSAAGIVALIFLCWIFKSPTAVGEGNVSESVNAELERVENLIIIEGLRHDAEPGSDSEDQGTRGKIIVDNSFLSGSGKRIIPSGNDTKSETKRSAAVTQSAAGETREFKELKRKDRRWHLTPYKIRRGDNLWEIAQRFNTDHRLIITINNITRPDMLRAGNRIQVPNKAGTYHRIKNGDTLSEIAHTYRVGQDVIKSHNNINDARLIAGNRIFIPDGKARIEPARREAREPERSQNMRNTLRHDAAPAAVAGKEQLKAVKATRSIAVNTRQSFSWPLRGRITSAFGSRINPLTRRRSFHTGIDIGVEVGTPVSASADGKVIFSGWKDVYGNMIIIKHPNGYITVYAHNKKNLVSENDTVSRGDKIALSGMTGFVTGPHLHYEIRKHLTPLNPRRLLR